MKTSKVTSKVTSIVKKTPAKRMAVKKPAAPTSGPSLKDKLAAGAAVLKKAQAEAAEAKKTAKPTAKEKATSKAVAVVVEPPPKPVKVDMKTPIEEILEKYVKVTHGNSAVEVGKECPDSAYVRIFDYFAALGEKVQFLLGDVINAGENILGEKYAAVMAATNRPIGQLKQYAYVARNVPPALRNLHPALGYTHAAAVAKVPQLADKESILKEAAKAATEGHPMTVKEVAMKADKLVPKKVTGAGRKPKGTPKGAKKKDGKGAPPPLEMSAEQSAMYDDVLEKARALEESITGPNAEPFRAFIFKIKYADKKALLDCVRPVGMLWNNLEKYLGYPN